MDDHLACQASASALQYHFLNIAPEVIRTSTHCRGLSSLTKMIFRYEYKPVKD
jgi:hypothetical protein